MVITKPGLATVRLGPIAGDVQAERAAGELRLAAASAAPAGTAVELVAYDPTRPHQPLAVPTDPAGLGELMEQMPAGDGTGRDFPDLVTRLAAQEGYGPAAGRRHRSVPPGRGDRGAPTGHPQPEVPHRRRRGGPGLDRVWPRGRPGAGGLRDDDLSPVRQDRPPAPTRRARRRRRGRPGRRCPGATRAAGPPRRPGPRPRDHADDGGATRPDRPPAPLGGDVSATRRASATGRRRPTDTAPGTASAAGRTKRPPSSATS